MATGRNNKLIGQIGEFLVCAELGRRGLIATPFAGNVPAFDILAADELCRTVPIQVKASGGDSWPADARLWMKIDFDKTTGRQNFIEPTTIANPDLIYVCVSIAPAASAQPDRFFVLTKSELQTVCIQNYSEWMDKRDWIRPRNPESYDARYRIANLTDYENRWGIITERLAPTDFNTPLEAEAE
ncbi:hypothetical protein B1R32_1113 [Abditibacterium utsteinense]|uniref:Aspartate ammonia-lyase n=1 Tax=Abditibacterium utsteinense TaxID=1960156 RepID=A0A2S8SRJ6_9BACT|nr:hypothetical protein [Abditibacterium utsteinense]PQV63442.1 hypothetical protein B1R32_1113 [Abditibacterium utsteinense]